MSTALRDARALAAAGWPICPIAPRSKLPATSLAPRGFLDATTDPTLIEGFFRAFPEIGIGVALEPAGLLVIGPDSAAWLAEFERRGLPRTAVAESREGHRFYFYRRPHDCPIYRLCKSGEYDIMTNGGAILPPSIHPDTKQPRRWIVAPSEIDGPLPEAPAWAVAMLEDAVITAVPLPSASISVDGDQAEPPVRLGTFDRETWEGKHPARKPDGDVDASEMLWGTGMMLARNNASEIAVATALAERDRTLGLNKYSSRRDGGRLEYWRVAVKVVQRVEEERAKDERTSGDMPNDCPAQLATLRAENERLRQHVRALNDFLADQHLTPGEKVTGHALAVEIAADPHTLHTLCEAPREATDPVYVPSYGITQRSGVGRSTQWRKFKDFEDWGVIAVRHKHLPDGSERRFISLTDPDTPPTVINILDRLRTAKAANLPPEEKRHGGRRVCPDCGRMHIKTIKTIHVRQCQDCGWQEEAETVAGQPQSTPAFQDETGREPTEDGGRVAPPFQDETRPPEPTPLFTPAQVIRTADRRQRNREIPIHTGAEHECERCRAATGAWCCANHAGPTGYCPDCEAIGWGVPLAPTGTDGETREVLVL